MRRGATWCSKSCAGFARRTDRQCSVADCDGRHKSRGLCEKHYIRLRLRGTTAPAPGDEWRDQTESERFWSKVDKSGECWLWTGPVNNMDYGRFDTFDTKPPKRRLAHRYALRDLGLLDESLIVLHACDTPRCVNPDHLSQGTQLDNIRDAIRKGRLDMSGLELGRYRRRAS